MHGEPAMPVHSGVSGYQPTYGFPVRVGGKSRQPTEGENSFLSGGTDSTPEETAYREKGRASLRNIPRRSSLLYCIACTLNLHG